MMLGIHGTSEELEMLSFKQVSLTEVGECVGTRRSGGTLTPFGYQGGCRFLRYLGLQKLICMPMFVKPLAYRECHLSIRLSCKYSTRSNTQAVPYIWRNYVM